VKRQRSIYFRLVSLFLTVAILVSSVGLTVNEHYCSTTKTLLKSVLSSNLDCKNDELKATACCADKLQKQHQKSCCTQKVTVVHNPNCCSNFKRYFKNSTVGELSNTRAQFIQNIALIDNIITISRISQNQTETFFSGFPDAVPIFSSGKILLTALHQLKIDLNCA